MSGTITSNQEQAINAAMTAAQSSAKTNAVSATSAGTSSTDSTSALSSLTDNFNTFLTLLTTQLKNQDPSSPMSSDTFTSELAQFAGVEQQVKTNTNLSTLIDITQNAKTASDSSLTGKKATATTTELPLQSGAAELNYTASKGSTLAVAVADASGAIVKTDSFTASAASGTLTWNGMNDNGQQLADGQYSVSVETVDSAGNTSAVPFTVTGTITGVTRSGDDTYLQMGDASVSMSDVTSYSDSTGS